MKYLSVDMNKQYYVVSLFKYPKNLFQRIFPVSIGEACIWPSDNWVEIHLFDNIITEIKTYEVDYVYDFKDISAHQFFVKRPLITDGAGNTEEASWVDAEYAICTKRLSSFIMSRKNVFGNKKRVFCKEITKDDYNRWNEWHPNDDYPQEIFLGDRENTIKISKRGRVRFITNKLNKQVVSDN